MLTGIVFGWIIPIYLYIGMFTLMFVIWKDRTVEGLNWKKILWFILLWPIVWFLIALLKMESDK